MISLVHDPSAIALHSLLMDVRERHYNSKSVQSYPCILKLSYFIKFYKVIYSKILQKLQEMFEHMK